jgi:hypothetical protein
VAEFFRWVLQEARAANETIPAQSPRGRRKPA